MTAGGPRVSVVIPCHSQLRWPQLVAAVESVLAQRPRPDEVVVAVDNNPALYDLASRELPEVVVLRNESRRGAAGNRNTAMRYTRSPLVAFLDDDARARPGWLAALLAPFADPTVVGTGGVVMPDWEAPRPGWYPDELLWAVGASFSEAPEAPREIRNVWSVTMAVRRSAFEAVGGFEAGFTKVGDRARPEDTDLCLRMTRTSGGRWLWVPGSVVDHRVPRERATLRYLLSRCFAEGRGKVCLARRHGGLATLAVERGYLFGQLPRAVARLVWEAVRGRGLARLSRATVLTLAAAVAGLGGLVELVSGSPVEPAPAPVPTSGRPGVPAAPSIPEQRGPVGEALPATRTPTEVAS